MKKRTHVLIAGTAVATIALIGTPSISEAAEEKKSYLIGFDEPQEVEQFTTNLAEEIRTQADDAIDVTYEFKEIPVLAVEMTEEEMAELKNEESISYIEEDQEVTTMAQSIPWGIERIGTPAAQASGFTGSGVSVAVLDTGIDPHSDLNIQGGVSFVPGESGSDDGNGHGTHVAGTIAALDNDQGVLGVAPDVDLFAVKVLSASGSGSISSIAQGLEWTAENNIDVANLSLGSPSPSQTLEQAVNDATDSGVLVVAAAGNSGTSSLGYPARYDHAMAVGATDESDSLASFSQYGEGLDLVAPGVGVESTYPGGGYDSLSGTSMAAPHVAGAAALVKQKNPSWTNEQIRGHLNDTANDLGDSFRFGSGLLNVENAVQ
ncbi:MULTISPECIES: S8 family peptidase [Shouchella]|uniref:Alkaline protease n=3 Tax=Bacillaceae TaxID=186817 RepID=A0A060LXJ8_9BACI|nr:MULTISPECIES: S8 family peptidase [Bacillaceae]AIC93003.1 alkaline protease [Shouchella lehensis G1]KQL56273.1 peptidase S8 [Alkalicoccobacillus plakortidis]MBG9783203.1 peptidase S8 [Shouchella lehensis]TES49425.1 peptidase S8 [Shouchella lehensis]